MCVTMLCCCVNVSPEVVVLYYCAHIGFIMLLCLTVWLARLFVFCFAKFIIMYGTLLNLVWLFPLYTQEHSITGGYKMGTRDRKDIKTNWWFFRKRDRKTCCCLAGKLKKLKKCIMVRWGRNRILFSTWMLILEKYTFKVWCNFWH